MKLKGFSPKISIFDAKSCKIGEKSLLHSCSKLVLKRSDTRHLMVAMSCIYLSSLGTIRRATLKVAEHPADFIKPLANTGSKRRRFTFALVTQVRNVDLLFKMDLKMLCFLCTSRAWWQLASVVNASPLSPVLRQHFGGPSFRRFPDNQSILKGFVAMASTGGRQILNLLKRKNKQISHASFQNIRFPGKRKTSRKNHRRISGLRRRRPKNQK